MAKKKKVIRHNCKEGKILGYKKVYCLGKYSDVIHLIAHLEIPAKARVVNAHGGSLSKHRACHAKVLKIEYAHSKKKLDSKVKVFSGHDRGFAYKAGRIVKPKRKFSPDKTNACKSGIHFFLHKKTARNYS